MRPAYRFPLQFSLSYAFLKELLPTDDPFYRHAHRFILVAKDFVIAYSRLVIRLLEVHDLSLMYGFHGICCIRGK